MNNLICYLLALSLLTLSVVILLRLLDIAHVISKQKIIFLKFSLLLTVFIPLIFILAQYSNLSELIITYSEQQFNAQKFPQLSQTILFTSKTSWTSFILFLYILGVSIMLLRIFACYVAAKIQLYSSKPDIFDGQEIFLSKHIKTPMSFGFPKAKIYLPSDAKQKFTDREIKISLAHERIHVEHYDSLWKLLSLIVRALLFFAPWMYYLHKRFELEMEIFCDSKTCAQTHISLHEYGDLLLAMASFTSHNLIFNNLTDSTLKKRFLAMKEKTRNAKYLIILNMALLLGISTTFAIASGATKTPDIFKISSKIMIDGKLISSPVMITKANQKALMLITNTKHAGAEGLRIELVARNTCTLTLNKAISVNYDVQYKNGNINIHTQPQFIVMPNQEAYMKLASTSHNYEMRVLVERE